MQYVIRWQYQICDALRKRLDDCNPFSQHAKLKSAGQMTYTKQWLSDRGHPLCTSQHEVPINYLKGTNWYHCCWILWLRGNILLQRSSTSNSWGKLPWHDTEWPSNALTGLYTSTHSHFIPSCFIARITWLIVSRRLLMSAEVRWEPDACHLLELIVRFWESLEGHIIFCY